MIFESVSSEQLFVFLFLVCQNNCCFGRNFMAEFPVLRINASDVFGSFGTRKIEFDLASRLTTPDMGHRGHNDWFTDETKYLALHS